MGLVVVEPEDPLPALPLLLTTGLRHIRALTDDIDLVNLYCLAATEAVEDYTGRSLITKTFRLSMEGWPSFSRGFGITRQADVNRRCDAIELPRSPLVAISSVNYYPDDGGAQTLWDATNYRADSSTLPGRLVLVDGYTLPSVAARPDAIEIEFTAGYGLTEAAMPKMLVLAIGQLARHFFDNPSAVDPEGKCRKMPYSYQHMLRSQKV